VTTVCLFYCELDDNTLVKHFLNAREDVQDWIEIGNYAVMVASDAEPANLGKAFFEYLKKNGAEPPVFSIVRYTPDEDFACLPLAVWRNFMKPHTGQGALGDVE
jgi:hypothetical protein